MQPNRRKAVLVANLCNEDASFQRLFLLHCLNPDLFVTHKDTLENVVKLDSQPDIYVHTLPLYGSGFLHARTFAANNPRRCLSLQLSTIFVGAGTSALICGGIGTKTVWEYPSFMLRRWPLPPSSVPRGSDSSAAR